MTFDEVYAGWTIAIEMDNPLAGITAGPVYDKAVQRDFEQEVRRRVQEAFPSATIRIDTSWDAPTWSRRVRARDPQNREDAERAAEHRVVDLLEQVWQERHRWAA